MIGEALALDERGRDLEVVEAMTSAPEVAKDTLVDLLPATFIVDWAARVRRDGDGAKILHGSGAAPTEVPDHIRWPADLALPSSASCTVERAESLEEACEALSGSVLPS